MNITKVLTLTQLYQGIVGFTDDPEQTQKGVLTAVTTREEWDNLGNPTTITVTVEPGGEFEPLQVEESTPDPWATQPAAGSISTAAPDGPYL